MIPIDALALYVRLIAAFGLAVASVQDILRREVDDRIWQAMIALALPAAVILAVEEGVRWLLRYLLWMALLVVLVLAMYHLRLIYGGDAKMLIALAVCIPPTRRAPMPPVLTAFMNGALLTLGVLPAILLWNLYVRARGVKLFEGYEASLGEKILAMITMVKVRYGAVRDHIGRKFALSEERKDGRRRLLLRIPGLEEARAEDYREDEYVWVMPALPFVAFVFAGFIIGEVHGNLAIDIAERIASLMAG